MNNNKKMIVNCVINITIFLCIGYKTRVYQNSLYDTLFAITFSHRAILYFISLTFNSIEN